MTEAQRFARAWRDRRNRRLTAVIAIVLVFAYLLAFNRFWPVPRSDVMRGVFFAGLSAWAVLAIAAIARILLSRCPSCRQRFNLSASLRDYTASRRTRCIHCQLPTGAGPAGEGAD